MRFIHKVGHDLDQAISGGLDDVFVNPSYLWCTRHLQEAHSRKLADMGANRKSLERILADIYGTQNGPVLEFGLADVDDSDDLDFEGAME